MLKMQTPKSNTRSEGLWSKSSAAVTMVSERERIYKHETYFV